MHPRKERKKPILPIRMVMQFASFVLCLLLVVSLDATVLVEDLHALTSSGGIHTILENLINYDTPDTSMEDALLLPTTSTTLVHLSNTTGTIPEDLEIPEDLDTSDADILTEYVCNLVNSMVDEENQVSIDQVHTFMEESTVMDYVAEKAPDVLHDLMTGNFTATFTTEEIMQLVDENTDLIHEVFNIEVTDELKQEMNARLSEAEANGSMDETLRTGIEQILHAPVSGSDGMEVGTLLQKLEWFTHIEAVIDGIIICIVLVGLIMLTNYYNLPRGLGWASLAHLLAGIVLSVPLIVIHVAPSVLGSALPADLLRVLDGAYSIMAPYHYAILIVGVVLSIGSITWGVVKKKHAVYA